MDWETITVPFTITTSLQFSNIIGDELFMSDRGTNFWKYNLKTKRFTQLSNGTADTNRIGGLIWKPTHGSSGKVYSPESTRIGIYNIAANTWSYSGSPPGSYNFRAICFQDDDTILVLGIRNPLVAARDCAWTYTISTNSWTIGVPDTVYNAVWNIALYSGELYGIYTVGGAIVKKYNLDTGVWSTVVTLAAGYAGIIGHDPDALHLYDGDVDYGYWKPKGETLHDDIVARDSISAGYQYIALMDRVSRTVIAQKNATELSVYLARIYHLELRNLSIDYEDKDKTKELHIALTNLSPTQKVAGEVGEVAVEVELELMA